jgi:hypothetical protein
VRRPHSPRAGRRRSARVDVGYLRLSAALDLPVTLQPDQLAGILEELIELRQIVDGDVIDIAQM